MTSTGPNSLPHGLAHEAEHEALASVDGQWLQSHNLTLGEALEEFDELAQLAAQACGTAMGRIHLWAQGRAWLLGSHGTWADDVRQRGASGGALPCSLVAADRADLELSDAQADPRTCAMKAVLGPQGIRFYSGLALIDEEGRFLGTLCVQDTKVGELDEAQRQVLQLLRRQVLRLLSMRRQMNRLANEQEDLAARQEAFEQSMEVAGETFWDWDLVTNEMDHARNRARMLGFEPEELTPELSTWVGLSHPDDQEPVAKLIRAHLAGHTPEYEAEYRQRHRDGHWIWVRSRGRVVERDPKSGKPLRMRGTVVDITRRKELEERIGQMNEELLQLVRSLPDAVLHKDAQGRWIFANPAAMQLFSGLRDAEQAAAEDKAWSTRAVQVQVERHEVQGRQREYEVQRVPVFDAKGQRSAMVVIAHDLWSQREQEEVLRRAAEQAQETARSKTQFLATMAHEIRTPLNSVVGAARLALMDEDPALRSEHLVLVHEAAHHLLELVGKVLDHSQLESGALQTEALPFSPRELMEQITGQLGPVARTKGLAWDTSISSDVPATLVGDPLRLRQVLNNLVSNAIKFTDAGSVQLQVRLRQDHRGAWQCVMEVRDTGIGLSTEQQRRLFQPFAQADPSIARRFGGTGLGLSISRQLMRAMGGELTVESELGVGSVFSMVWPCLTPEPGRSISAGMEPTRMVSRPTSTTLMPSPAESASVQLRAAAAPALGHQLLQEIEDVGRPMRGRHILVVDDNRMNVVVVTRFLHRAGLKVTAVSGGRQALDVLLCEPVDAVLMDLYMPEMNGDEAVRLIRAHPSLKDLPVLALSATVTLDERERCAAAGMNDFVAKPVDPLELLAALSDWLPQQP